MQKTKRMMKGFTVTAIGPLAISLVVISVIIAMGAMVLTNLQGEQTAGTAAYNVTGQGIEAMSNFGTWLPTIAIIIIFAVIIGILVMYLMKTGRV